MEVDGAEIFCVLNRHVFESGETVCGNRWKLGAIVTYTKFCVKSTPQSRMVTQKKQATVRPSPCQALGGVTVGRRSAAGGPSV